MVSGVALHYIPEHMGQVLSVSASVFSIWYRFEVWYFAKNNFGEIFWAPNFLAHFVANAVFASIQKLQESSFHSVIGAKKFNLLFLV